MGQRHRKSYLIQSFGIPADLREKMLDAVARQNRNTRGVPLNASQWIRRAIARDLSHGERSRRKRGQPVPAVL